jgi:transcriptional regulator with XRE-family HTH domain
VPGPQGRGQAVAPDGTIRGVEDSNPVSAMGDAIKEIRLLLLERDDGYTQERVAYESGTSLGHYRKIEAGKVDLRATTLFAIAGVLGRKPQQILDRADELRTARKR